MQHEGLSLRLLAIDLCNAALTTQILDYARDARNFDVLLDALGEASAHATDGPSILQLVLLTSRLRTVLEALLAGTSPSRAWAAVARSQCRTRHGSQTSPALPDTPVTPATLVGHEEDVKPNLAGLGIVAPVDQKPSTPSRKRSRGADEAPRSNGRAGSDPGRRQRMPTYNASDELVTLVISGLPIGASTAHAGLTR